MFSFEDHNHQFNWVSSKSVNVECMIDFVEAQKDEDFNNATKEWGEKFRDESRKPCSEFRCTKCCMEGDPTEWNDHWSNDHRYEPTNGTWIRHHSQSRTTLFTPAKTAHGPKDTEALMNKRVTIGQFEGGEHFYHVDNQKEPESAHRKLRQPWTGTTVFHSI